MERNINQKMDEFILNGPKPTVPIPKHTVGVELYNKILAAPKDAVAMIDVLTREKLLYSEMLQRSVNLAETLRIRQYVGPDKILALSSANSTNFFVPVIASLLCGSVLSPLNFKCSSYELAISLSITRPKIIFCSRAVVKRFVELKLGKLYFIEKIVVLDDDFVENDSSSLGIVESISEFINSAMKGRNVNDFKPTVGDIADTPAFIMSSSGTTGLPKGVVLSHLNLMIGILHSRDPLYWMQDNDTFLGILPFFHLFGLGTTLAAICNLKTIICMPQFQEDVFLKAIETYKLKVLNLVPPLGVFLAKTNKIHEYDLSSMKELYFGGALLSEDIESQLRKRFNCRCRQGYGMTETSEVFIVERDKDKPGSCGKVVSYMSAKIRDLKTGYSLGPQQIGEVCIKGSSVMMGYYKNDNANKEAFTSDGWLKSGDLGYYDQAENVYIVDRLKELIKYKGYQVAPAELEAVLFTHPKIKDVAVVGKPDEVVGERPVAFIVKQDGEDISENEIKKYVCDRVSCHKRLSGGVVFVRSIPKNTSGKVLRNMLRKNFRASTKNECKSKL